MKGHYLLLTALAAFSLSCSNQQEFSYLYQDLPFEMPALKRPQIPSQSVSIVQFDAVGDGVTLNTEAFARAVDALCEKGGGKLVVPEGIWFTGPIELKSNIELHLEKGAVIVFSSNQDLYPVIDTNFEGLDVRRCTSPINATGASNIAITGEGIIDGNGQDWREVKRRKVGDDDWKRIVKRGGVLSDDEKVWFPDEGYKAARATAGTLNKPADDLDEAYIKTFLRPVMVSLRECENVLLEGVTFQNSPCWNLHPLWCKNVIINDIKVRNPHYSANGDGIDIDACENVILVNSTFDVGDDAICIKSGKDADGRTHARACKNLIIDGCTVYHGHGGFVIGSEMSGGVQNIKVSHCSFLGTDVGLRFKSARGRGGLVQNINCDHIYMKDMVAEAITFNLYYAGVAATERKADTPTSGEKGVSSVAEKRADAPSEATLSPAVDETTPEFRDIRISDVVCAGAKQAIYVNGLPELPLDGLEIRNSVFSAVKKGLEIYNAVNPVFENVTINGEQL